MGTELWGILAGIVLTVGTGIFVGSEFALVNSDRKDLEQRQVKGETRLGLTIEALQITSTHLSATRHRWLRSSSTVTYSPHRRSATRSS
ncbi:MAG: hypothetical protein QM628_04960 [Propionicimonas sp.]